MSEIKSYLTFKVGEEEFAVNAKYVQNIIEYVPTTKMPDSPKEFHGVINLRGKAIPVIDTRIKFGMQPGEITNKSCILNLELNVNNEVTIAGILVDSVSEVLEIDKAEIQETPKLGTQIKADYLSGMYTIDNKFIFILNTERLFTLTAETDLNLLTDKAAS